MGISETEFSCFLETHTHTQIRKDHLEYLFSFFSCFAHIYLRHWSCSRGGILVISRQELSMTVTTEHGTTPWQKDPGPWWHCYATAWIWNCLIPSFLVYGKFIISMDFFHCHPSVLLPADECSDAPALSVERRILDVYSEPRTHKTTTLYGKKDSVDLIRGKDLEMGEYLSLPWWAQPNQESVKAKNLQRSIIRVKCD